MGAHISFLLSIAFDVCDALLNNSGAPTGSGKTVLSELAMVASLGGRLNASGTGFVDEGSFKNNRAKVVYLAPLRALVAEKLENWKRRFGPGTAMNLRFAMLTGDVDDERTRSSGFWREVDNSDHSRDARKTRCP